jgi:hypothetical protein
MKMKGGHGLPMDASVVWDWMVVLFKVGFWMKL